MPLKDEHLVLSVACGTNARAYLVQVSDQRGTCLVERPAKGELGLPQPP